LIRADPRIQLVLIKLGCGYAALCPQWLCLSVRSEPARGRQGSRYRGPVGAMHPTGMVNLKGNGTPPCGGPYRALAA